MGKKGAIMQALIGLAILIVTFFVILQIYKAIGAQTEGVAAEEFCRQTNALKMNLGDTVRAAGFSPQGCRKIEINDPIPAKEATEKIGDLTARCWWMWLEGLTKDGKSADVLDPSLGASDRDCFVCYTFSLEKGTAISIGKLSEALRNEVYRVEDGSDKCASKGGGYCQESCETLENPNAPGVFAEAVRSDKCKAQEKCCVAAVKGNDCLNKGGKCEAQSENFYGGGETVFARNNRWTCSKRGESCFVPQKQFLSYVGYIQEGGRGPGMLALSKEVVSKGLTSGKLYAVVFNEDTTAAGAGALVGAGVMGTSGALAGFAVGAKVGGAIGTGILPGFGTLAGVIVGGVAGLASGVVGYTIGPEIVQSFEKETFDQIVIANMEEVNSKDFACAVQYGVKG